MLYLRKPVLKDNFQVLLNICDLNNYVTRYDKIKIQLNLS